MAENLTQLPEGFLDELNLDETRKKILIDQINRFHIVKNETINNKEIIFDDLGNVVFSKGTLIHGASYCDLEKLNSIAATGILTGQAIGIGEDGETFYCADFHRVPLDMSVSEYSAKFPYKDSRTPFTSSGKNSIAFVVHPCAEIGELLSYDCYRSDTEESKLTRSFVNGLPIKESELASSILYGVPSSCFSGVILGDNLISDKAFVTYVSKLFSSCYITSKRGEIIYDPTLSVVDAKELMEIRREKCLLRIENENLKNELNSKNHSLLQGKQNYDNLMQAIVNTCSLEDAARVLLATGWQGTLETTMQYIEGIKGQTR